MKYLIVVFLLILGYVFYLYRGDEKVDYVTTAKIELDEAKQSSLISSVVENQLISSLDNRSLDDNLITSSLDVKLKNEKKLDALKASEKLNENIQTIVLELKAKGIDLPSDLLERMNDNILTDADFKLLMERVSRALPEGEVEFRKSTLGFGMGFDELNRLYSERSKITGLNYDQEMIGNPQIYKDISIDEIDALLSKGSVLPAGVINHISKYQRTDLLNHLHENGYLSDLNYVSPHTHRNAVEEFVDQYTSAAPNASDSTAIDAAKSLEYLDHLLGAGVALSPNDNTRDALDFAIQNMSATNAGKVAVLVQKLLDAGLKVDASHIELLKQFQNSHPIEYDQYVRPVVGGYSKLL